MTDDPRDLALVVASLPSPLLIGTDVDGTLSDLTEHPGESRLVEGARDALVALQERGCEVAVVSGRPLADLLGQFGIPPALHLIGSHGAERGGSAVATASGSPRTDAEAARLAEVTEVLEQIAGEHEGAWVERKPFAAALHVRPCTAEVAERALLAGRAVTADMADVRVLEGHQVLEVAVRDMSKRVAFGELRERLRPAAAVFIGDDRSDEGVFESFGASDVSIKVGPGATLAGHRLAAPRDTARFLTELATLR